MSGAVTLMRDHLAALLGLPGQVAGLSGQLSGAVTCLRLWLSARRPPRRRSRALTSAPQDSRRRMPVMCKSWSTASCARRPMRHHRCSTT
jgi:hypothetical protein